MKYLIHILICTFGILFGLHSQESIFIPDKSINGIFIFDSLSLKSKIPNICQLIDHEGPGARVCLLNNQKYQLLTLIFHSGSNAYEVAEIKVEFANSDLDNNQKQILNADIFKTESGIKLNMGKQELINIKGNDYQIESLNGIEVLTYKISDFNKSDILKEYNMPEYYARYKFKNGSLIEFQFGFTYP